MGPKCLVFSTKFKQVKKGGRGSLAEVPCLFRGFSHTSFKQFLCSVPLKDFVLRAMYVSKISAGQEMWLYKTETKDYERGGGSGGVSPINFKNVSTYEVKILDADSPLKLPAPAILHGRLHVSPGVCIIQCQDTWLVITDQRLQGNYSRARLISYLWLYHMVK